MRKGYCTERETAEKLKIEYNRQRAEFVCAAGILSHYVGDACQVLHGSFLSDGDKTRTQQRQVRRRNGTIETVTERYGAGVHSEYESKMLNKYVDEMMTGVLSQVGNSHGLNLVTGGQEAGFAIVGLMKETRVLLPPMSVVETYAQALQNNENTNDALWEAHGMQTQHAIANGCRYLAMLWESAWLEGQWQNISNSQLSIVPSNSLKSLYQQQNFLPSLALDELQL